jgi:hypothetical protein
VNVLEWPSQSPDLNPIEYLWRDLKIALQRLSPSNLTELERICREEWEKLPKYRCAKLVASYPRRLKAGIAGSEYFVNVLYLAGSEHLCVNQWARSIGSLLSSRGLSLVSLSKCVAL